MKTNYIISKWVAYPYSVAITAKGEVYCINTQRQLIKESHKGCIMYRYPKTANRIGRKTLRTAAVPKAIIIKIDCPF